SPCGNVSNPALTRPIVVMVVALDDCTISVATAPHQAPRSGVAAALSSTVRSAEPASPFRPPVMTVMPSKNRPTPPRIEIVIDMARPRPTAGAHRSAGIKQSGRLLSVVRPGRGGVAVRDAGLVDLIGQVAPAFRHVQKRGAVAGVIRLFRHQYALGREVVIVAGAVHPESPLERG